MEERVTSRNSRWHANGRDFDVHIQFGGDGGIARIGDEEIPFSATRPREHGVRIQINNTIVEAFVWREGRTVSVWLDGVTYRLEPARQPGMDAVAPEHDSGAVVAPLPGKVVRVEAQAGSVVEAGQTLAIMESMKMESVIVAPRAGRVSRITVEEGQIVEMGELLIFIE